MKEVKNFDHIITYSKRSYLFEKNILLNYYESVNIFNQFLNQFEESNITIVRTGSLPDTDSLLRGPDPNTDCEPKCFPQGIDITYESGTFWIDIYPEIDKSDIKNIPNFISNLISLHKKVVPNKSIGEIYDDEMTFISNLHREMYKKYIRIIKPIQLELSNQIHQIEQDETLTIKSHKNRFDDDKSDTQTTLDILDFFDIEKIKKDLEELNRKDFSHKYITWRKGSLTFKKPTHLYAYLNENYPVIEHEYRKDIVGQLAAIFKLKINYSSEDPFQLLRKPHDISPNTRKFFQL